MIRQDSEHEEPSTERNSAHKHQRFWEVDAARGVAILMMVVYHLTYDLDTFGGYGIESTSGFWAYFADTTAFAFVFLVGVSLAMSHSRAVRRGRDPFGRYLWRGLKILGYGMLITLVFWAFGLGGVIIFGILHLIGVSIILAYPFRNLGISNAVLGILVIAVGLYIGAQNLVIEGPWLAPFGVLPADLLMPDYRPLLPWFGVVLIGLFFGNAAYGKGKSPIGATKSPPFARPLGFLGRHSLFIYLVHQPILIATLAALGIIQLGGL
jgi:uncharacterized membrane protein